MALIAPEQAVWVKRGLWLVAILIVGFLLANGANGPADPYFAKDTSTVSSPAPS